MKEATLASFAVYALMTSLGLASNQGKSSPPPDMKPPTPVPVIFREVRYNGKVTDDEARFAVEMLVDATTKQQLQQTLFEGDLAMLPPKLPAALKIERSGKCYRLLITRPGQYHFNVEIVAKIMRAEPWNQISFKGPEAAIAAIQAQATGTEVDLQLMNGTLLESTQTNGVARIAGVLGVDPTVSLRWSGTGGPAEVSRTAVVTADTSASAQITPTVIKYLTQVHYEILQGKLTKVTLALPLSHTVSRLAGEQIRDWEIKRGPAAGQSPVAQILSIQFIKPIEKEYQLTVYSEQSMENTGAVTALNLPEPLELERESGSLTLSAEDTLAAIDSVTGLRQVNAPAGALAAYRFSGRPFALGIKLQRIEPVIQVAERVNGHLEETRLQVLHSLSLDVEKAGVYSLDLQTPPDQVVGDVRGEGIEDWKLVETGPDHRKDVRISFASRLLGTRKLEIQLEQSFKFFPEQVAIGSVHVKGAMKETAQVGASSSAGIRIKTGRLSGLREIPIGQLAGRKDELLAYTAEQADWSLTLSSERLSARIAAQVFNLITIGDGIVGGSATIRYGLANQGVQEFELALPPEWRNVEFTGPKIRRKEEKEPGKWVIGLQDKAWGGYTLVVTYDHQFDPQGATLLIGGIRTLGIERENGTIAITTAASLKVNVQSVSETLSRVDEGELDPGDRALITRAVLLAYEYSQPTYRLAVQVKRHAEVPVLAAVADRAQMTTVLNEAGELLTQASFMVKNNDKQFQRFRLAKGARFWNCYVNGQPVKAERDQDWFLVPLPRSANRDQAFAVDIVYAEKQPLASLATPRLLQLGAPQTDVPNTYAEWHLYAPEILRLSGFGGNMLVARGTTYDLREAWQRFLAFYREMLSEAGYGLLMGGMLLVLIVVLIGSAVRRGWSGVLGVLAFTIILAVLGAMLLPALARAKARAQRINSVNNLKQIGLAARTFALDNGNRFPVSFEEMLNELGTDKVTYDPDSGQRYVYLGGGLDADAIAPDSVICFSPSDTGKGRNVLLADGSVHQLSSDKFAELTRRGYLIYASPAQVAQSQQMSAVRQAQFQSSHPPPTLEPTPPSGTNGSITVASAAGIPTSSAAPGASTRSGGVRAIRIEIPRTGQLVTFSKLLHLGGDPLSIQARVMKVSAFQTRQMSLQLAAFTGGLLLGWWQWRRATRNSFLLTAALALILGSVGALLLAWRMLHLGFIWVAPLVLLVFIAWLAWKYWPRAASAAQPAPRDAGLEPGLPPAVAAIALLCVVQAVQAADSSPVILSATYLGSVNERVAQMDATLELSASAAGQMLNLFAEDVAIQTFSARPGDAKLVRNGTAYAVQLRRSGQVTLQVKFLVKLGGEITKRELSFGIPAALSSRLSLTIGQPEADIEFPTAISFKRSGLNQATRVEALIGAGDRVELRWTPRVKRAADIAANVICQNATLASFGNGVLNTRARLDYQVTQGELRQLRVRLPPGHRLLRVEGEAIRTWELAAPGPDKQRSAPTELSQTNVLAHGEQVLLVELLKGVAPNYRLTVETEKELHAMPASTQVDAPQALEVKRETGLLGLRAEEELELTIERADELSRVDAEEFARVTGEKSAGMPNAFRFLKPGFLLQARVAAMEPQIEALVRNQARLSPEQVRLTALIEYTIKRAGVFSLQFSPPAGYRLEAVTGEKILQWIERSVSPPPDATPGVAPRIVQVIFKERISGPYSLRIELERNLRTLPNSVDFEGVQPLGAQKLIGFVSVVAEPGVTIKPAAAEGLTEIPAIASPEAGASVLAYKFAASEASTLPSWRLSVATEAVEAWLRVEMVNTLALSESLVSGRALARFDIQNAPVKELRLRVPADFRNVEISGQNIRRRDQTGEVWRIEFQNKVRGPQTLTVTWDQANPGRTNLWNLRGISAEGVERETGILAIVARPPLQVKADKTSELKAIDLRDLPEWAGRPDDATVLAYHYLRPNYTLAVEARRFDEAEVLQALAENISLTSVLAEDGQMMTSLALALRNNGRQHLEIELPAGCTVWSAFVAGQAVRPSVRDDKLLLPLDAGAGEDGPFPVELTYVGTNSFPLARGWLELVSPRLDTPLKGARWELFLPADYRYSDFGGTMAPESAGATSEATSFSFLDYAQKESQNKAELDKELKSNLSKAKSKLSSGKVKEAWNDYSRARNGKLAQGEDAETRKLEEELNRAQGSNLISAQNSFSLSHSGKSASQSQAQVPEQAMRYEAAAAEAQWIKLQQAQELGAANIQPIRVNLPTRGLRHVFTQVLQTEVNRPLTIHLRASSTRLPSWPARMGIALFCFATLWALVAAGTHRRLRTSPSLT